MNPYAPPPGGYPVSPQHPHAPQPYGYGQQQFHGHAPRFEAYAQGSDLIVSKMAPLPEVCMKCGLAQPGLEKRYQGFTYVPGWAYLTFFLGVLIGAIFVMIFQKQGSLVVPLCQRCSSRWKIAVLARGLSMFAFVVLLVGTPLLLLRSKMIGWGFLCGAVVAIVQLIVVIFAFCRPRILVPRSMDDWRMTLGGVHPDALNAACQYAAMYGRG